MLFRFWVMFTLLAVTMTLGCQRETPHRPSDHSLTGLQEKTPLPTFTSHWLAPETMANDWPSGFWQWECKSQESPGGPHSPQRATLEVLKERRGKHIQITFNWYFQQGVPLENELGKWDILPKERSRWHGILNWKPGTPGTTGPFPVPVVPLTGQCTGTLLELLELLTASYFESTTCHWPSFPVPVRVGNAQSGQVNLSDCLLEAAQRWNGAAERPWFEAKETADWGVQLVHFPDAIMHPPLRARITRLDDEGRPQKVQILVGANYSTIQDRPYAVRGMAHELGHALFLWAHSPDRSHLLWGTGPPLVEGPSSAERKAAQWMHGLPEGLNLDNYFNVP